MTARYLRREVKQTVIEFIWANYDAEEDLIGMSDSIMLLNDVIKFLDYISICFYFDIAETNL